MAVSFSTTLRAARSQSIITSAGANSKLKFYNGSRPSVGGGLATGTLLGTLNFGSVFGTTTAGVLTVAVGSITQTAASHVTGLPTWARLTTSADVFVADFSIPTDMTFNGSIATGTPIDFDPSSITEGNI